MSRRKVQWWLQRAGAARLDRVDFRDQRRGAPSNRTERGIEDLVVEVRHDLKAHSLLGEYGDAAIHRALCERGIAAVPSVRTIGRILERRGVLDGRTRRRHPAPPRGWYVPDVASGTADIDSFDLIEDLRIQQGPFVDVLTAISVHGGLAAAWPVAAQASAQCVMERLLAHWQAVGLPAYAQFDNDTRFQGAHQHRDVLSRVMRACMSLAVTPIFVPPRESGFQAACEAFNGRWQRAVWQRFHHDSLAALQTRSAAFIRAHRQRHAVRLEHAPLRRPFPTDWRLDLQRPPAGQLIYLRRTDDTGCVSALGHRFLVDAQWVHRLVRCEVDVEAQWIRFFALRRKAPEQQPLLRELRHAIPQRRFRA